MSGGWIAQGADQPAATGAAPADPWTPTAPDTPSVPALVRPHQDPNAHPVDNSRGLFTQGKDLLFGHEPENAQDPDQAHVAGVLPSIGASVDNSVGRLLKPGPDISTLAHAYPHLAAAELNKVGAGYQETTGAVQVQNAERQLAALNVLPQVAARYVDKNGIADTAAMAKDPNVQKVARKLGIDPKEFAGDWSQYAGLSSEQQADTAARARTTLDAGNANKAAGQGNRNQAWADERTWQPTDLKNGALDPWSLKGIAFNTALAIPGLAAVGGATVAGTAVGGPGVGLAAGGATAAALFAPAQREDAKNKIDDQVNRLLTKADDLDALAPVGGKRGLNPVTEQIRQQAADLAASSDKIANTAGFLYAVSDVAGAVPVASVLTRSPFGKAVLDRMVGAAAGQTVGGRVAGSMVANGAGGMLQASIQKAVDAGIVHENTSLKDALADIAYTGIVSAATAAPIAAAHEAAGAPGRAQAKRDLDSDELLNRVKTASDNMGAAPKVPGEDYPGYTWNETTGRYEPSATNPAGNATKPRISGTTAPFDATKGPNPETNTPPGAPGQRQAYQAKVDALNTAAAAAEKRSDVTLEPEEEGWSVHVKGQPVAQFDTVEAAREAMAQARKVVGTQPASTQQVSPETSESTAERSTPAAEGVSTPVKTPQETAVERQPESELERTQPAQPERRSATELRQRVADMTPEQMKAALLTHELTGMPNRRAYEDAEKLPVQVSADSDGLKAINDFGGHAAGDQALKAVAAAMQAESPNQSYHISGDEFTAQAHSEDEAHDLMARVNKRLEGAIVEVTMPDGKVFHLKGLGVSYGVGKDIHEADGNLKGSKTQREAEGLRAPRGVLPPGATIKPGEAGREGHGGTVAGEPGEAQGLTGGGGGVSVLGQKVKPPQKPTVGQATAGNYFKPTVQWHGLPIKVENVKGQQRRYLDAKTGKPGQRVMKADYGYIPGTKGNDEDGVDVMMGPHHEAPNAYVIDQLDHTGKSFDEHKVQVGVRSAAEAREQYLSHYPKDWKGLGGITELNPDQLKRWLKEGDLTQPIAAESVPQAKTHRGAAPDARHDSILQYLARHPQGLSRSEAQSQGIDPADMALAAAHVGIKRAFRTNGMSFDHAAETLHQDGYPVHDAEGHYSPNVLLDRISDELRGTPHYSTRNESQLTPEARDWRHPLTSAELAKLTVDQARTRLAELQQEQERLEREIERAGLAEDTEHETVADLERIPFQRKEGGQQDLFGDKVHVQNEIKRLEALLDKKRSSGQESVETGRPDDLFSAARQQMDLPKIGEENTLYEIREPVHPPRATARGRRAAASVRQLDIFANAADDRPAVQAARLAQSVRLAHIGEFRSGIKQVKTWEDAAHILAPLRKYPQENMTALVLDKAGKPLAVIRHSIGQADAASVEPWSLTGSIVQVPGAAQVFFAHNHPSGHIGQSTQDEVMTGFLHNLLEGSGIQPRGMIVVGPNSRSATYFRPDHGSEEAPITAARRQGAVSVQERRFGRLRGTTTPQAAQQINGPLDARRVIEASGERSGVVLANNRHKVLGIVPMTPDEMMKLRSGDTGHGAARLLKAMAEANSNALISFGPLAAARNVASFATASGAKALDAMTWNDDGDLTSSSEHGTMLRATDQGFLQRQFKPPEGWEEATGQERTATLSPAEIRSSVDKFLAGFAVKPDVVIAKNLAELKQDSEIGHTLEGAQEGEVVGFMHPATMKVYLVANQLHGAADIAATLAHEVVTHYGLRAAFGDRRAGDYQAILDGVARAMPAEMRRRGEREFPGGFNPLNAHHRNVAAEETLAYYGQRYANDQSIPARIKRWLDKLHAMLRDWLRSVLGLPKKFDELFVKRTLADLESFLRKGSKDYSAGPRETEPAFAGPEDTFFSGLAKAVDAAKRDKGTGAEWEATLRNMPGVKAEELQWTGLKDWLEGRGRVSKAEVAEFVHAHRVQVGEVQHGGAGQRPLTTEDINLLNERMAAAGYGQTEVEQDQALRAGGNDTEHMLEELHRMGISVKDMLSPSGSEAVIAQLREMGYGVKESEDGGQYMIALTPERQDEEVIDPEARRLFQTLESGGQAPPKFPTYVAPGGKNYRELLLTLPEKPNAEKGPKGWGDTAGGTADALNYRGSHWDEPNVLAHIRFDDRTGPQGERVLHIAEVQSDWHQQGRRQGYQRQLSEKERAEREKQRQSLQGQLIQLKRQGQEGGGEWHALLTEYETVKQEIATGSTAGGVPEAPFKTSWPELAMKRMLRYAAEHGYDALSWDTGDTNAERYDLSKHLARIQLHDNSSGGSSLARLDGPLRSGNVAAFDHDGKVALARHVQDEKELVDLIGKDATDKLLAAEPKQGRSAGIGFRHREIGGLDLKVGGEGMRAFYDKMLPATVGKLVKKWGSSVEPGQVLGGEKLGGKYRVEEDSQGRWVAYNPQDQYDYREFGTQHEAMIFARDNVGAEQYPAHTVKITPAMRDSVMAGQPMFLKRRKGSGGVEPPAPKRGAYNLARRAIAAIPNSEFSLSLRRIADPSGVSPPAMATAVVTREVLGELAQASEEALQNLERYAKQFDLLGTDDRMAFIDAMEGGERQANQDLQPAADAIRKLLDDWRERIRGLGTGALDNFIENYFPHIWADDSAAKKFFGQIFGRRPLKGPASFLKERTIPTTKEGIAAGLKPVSTNPLILAFAKLREMQRFYTGVKLMQRFKDEGLAKFLPSGKLRPDDWAEIEDAVGRVRQWSEAEQGFIERGHYIMPIDAARVINNHLSGSALRNFLPAQVFRSMSNAANALQLGFSGFHLGFTTLDAVISKNALGIERLLHGEPLRAARAFLEASTGIGGAAMNLYRGHQLLKAYANTGAASPLLRQIVAGLSAAGGRVKMDNYFQAARGLSPFKGVGFATLAHDVKMALTQPHGKVWAATQALTSFPQQYATRLWGDLVDMAKTQHWPWLTVPLEVAGRMTRASTSIIMEHIVPLQKLGVFSDLAADHIRRNPLEDPVAFADSMQKIWNSVDNRLGEMVYDNVFWNRTFKDVNHMMVRAVGWNLGTIRELGGAPIDMVKVLDYLARGAPAEDASPDLTKASAARLEYERQKSRFQRAAEKVGHKIPYTLALIGTTMILGGILTRLFTGKDPEDIKDYFFPWTGRMTKYGTKERISMPSYTKDLVEYGTQPMTTIINKANPIFGIMHAIYANEDFFGNAVRDPDASFFKQLWQGAKYAGREVLPFSVQGTKQFVGAGDMDSKGKILSTMPYVGFGPAPARVTSPEEMERYQLRETEKSYIRGLQRQLKAATERGEKEEVTRLRGEIRDSKLKEHGAEHDIRADKVKAHAAAAKISALIQGRSREDAATALAQAGLPAFAALWRSLPESPRPRVAQSLGSFA